MNIVTHFRRCHHCNHVNLNIDSPVQICQKCDKSLVTLVHNDLIMFLQLQAPDIWEQHQKSTHFQEKSLIGLTAHW